MTTLAIIAFWILVVAIAMQTILGLGFVRVLARAKPRDSSYCPKVALVLSLRGADPFLDQCLRAILNQDYPNFEVRIVIDGEDDPAWKIVRQILDSPGSSRVYTGQLMKRNDTCSLKCSSVSQAVRELDSSFEVVAILDADTIAHPTWLRELVAPLEDPHVGAATGNRWYMPTNPTLGSLVRYCWNGGAATIMYWCNIAWGGTLAIRRSAIEKADLLNRWQNAFCEDTMLFTILRKHGLRQVFVPTLMMVNRESCTLRGVYNWISRQLLTARLYHPGWWLTVSHCLATLFAPLLSIVIGTIAIVAHNSDALAWSVAGFVLYQLALAALLVPIEFSVRRVMKNRGELARWWTPATVRMLPIAILTTQIVYPMTVLSALLRSTVEWRGVHYRVEGPWRIRLQSYMPFCEKLPIEDQQSL